MKQRSIYIEKASGEKVVFSPDKLSKSLQRSGANAEAIDSILSNKKNRFIKVELKPMQFIILSNNLLNLMKLCPANDFNYWKPY